MATSSKFKTNMKIMATTIAKGTFAFKRIFLTYVVVLLIGGLIYAVFSVYSSINSILEDSRSTPWGIVTSIFAHSSLEHITLNMAVLFLFVLLFAFCNSILPPQDKRKVESFFLVSSFGSAIGIGLGCLITCYGPYLMLLGNFTLTSISMLVGLLLLAYGTLDLNRNMESFKGNIISIMILSIFWTAYFFVNPYLYNQAITENILHTWQTFPWILAITMNCVLQVFSSVSLLRHILT